MQVMLPGDFRSFSNEFKNNNITKLDLTQTNRVVLAANGCQWLDLVSIYLAACPQSWNTFYERWTSRTSYKNIEKNTYGCVPEAFVHLKITSHCTNTHCCNPYSEQTMKKLVTCVCLLEFKPCVQPRLVRPLTRVAGFTSVSHFTPQLTGFLLTRVSCEGHLNQTEHVVW